MSFNLFYFPLVVITKIIAIVGHQTDFEQKNLHLDEFKLYVFSFKGLSIWPIKL